MGVAGTGKSWHNEYKDSAWIFTGGLPYDLTEGDVICVFSQYGEVVHINLIRDHKTGKSKGFGFICYEDQRSTILAVDNLNGMKLFLEGCAPKPIEQEPIKEESEEEILEYKSEKKKKLKKKKIKKEKKAKKKHKRKEYSSESSDSNDSSDNESKRSYKKDQKAKKKHKRKEHSSESSDS